MQKEYLPWLTELFSSNLQVVLKALDPSFEIENPYVPYIQGKNNASFCQWYFVGVAFFAHHGEQKLYWC